MAYDANLPADNLIISAIPGEIRQKGVDVKSIIDAHTSDTTDAHTASAITNVANGNISANTVQGAINELDTEKVNVSDIVTVAAANKILKLNSNAKLPADITGNSAAADKLKTAFSIELTGDVSGSVSTDCSSKASIETTVSNDSHSHTAATLPVFSGTNIWVSPIYTPATGQLIVTHGLSGLDLTKARAEIVLRCSTATLGYAVGDVITGFTGYYSSSYPAAQQVCLSDTNVSTHFLSSSFYMRYKDETGTYANSNFSNWQVFFRIIY